MRVSTAQFYFQNSLQLSNKQTDVNDQIEYIASGKRVLTAKDDAVAFGTLVGYKDELAAIEKYQRNITQAENRNSLVDTSFANAERLLQDIKQKFIQANNGTLSDADLESLGALIQDGQEQLLDIANIKDETGGYIFAGFAIDVQPFSLQPDNTVNYNGDSGERELQIAKNILVGTNIPGDKAFEDVPNVIGDFSPVYNTNNSGISVTSAKITSPGLYDDSVGPPPAYQPDFQFNFGPTAQDLNVTDADGDVLYTTAAYVPGQIVPLANGVEVQISGNPLPGDSFDITPEEDISVFQTLKEAIDWVNTGNNPANPLQHEVDYGEILEQIDAALNHMTSQRTEAGTRLSLIENQDNNHQDTVLYLEQGRSNIEDLDFAKAIAEFEQSQVALQAAQQTFVQVKDLSLFNYI
ncbi:flagellar hook-associated protein FlgL [Thalassotalea euphylliae]|uniref:flagellar hook-associated protein FlgL n=1 Tax=Thalassotalea euphylliae TaxID=1655234 RepID=UPI00362C27C8